MRINAGVALNSVGLLIVDVVGFAPNAAALYITSGTDGDHGTVSHHYGNLSHNGSRTAAADVGGGGVTTAGSRAMRDVARWVYTTFPADVVELIHTTPYDDDEGFYIRRGVKHPNGTGWLTVATMAAHLNHVHLAMSEAGARAVKARLISAAPRQEATMQYGVDVHDGYQAGLSVQTLVAQGYTFAAVKLTQGTTYARDRGDDWVRAARDAGLIPGGYHWLTSADGAEQARWFWRKVREAGGPDGMLIQLDVEDDGYGPQILAWAAEWNRLSNHHPFLIYSGAWWWNSPDRPMRGVRGVDVTPYLWHSRYLTADSDTVPDDPAEFAARIPATWWAPGYGGWPTVTILQFTSRGDAGGLGNKVDLNVFRGDGDALLALTGAHSGGTDDMTPNQAAVLDGIFNLADTVDLDTGAGVKPFPVPITEAIKDIQAKVAAPTPVTVDATAVAAALAANAEFMVAMAAAAFEGAQRAERE